MYCCFGGLVACGLGLFVIVFCLIGLGICCDCEFLLVLLVWGVLSVGCFVVIAAVVGL